jgi:hypothetical protein
MGREKESLAEKPTKPTQIYGFGFGLKGWFGEDVEMQ